VLAVVFWFNGPVYQSLSKEGRNVSQLVSHSPPKVYTAMTRKSVKGARSRLLLDTPNIWVLMHAIWN